MPPRGALATSCGGTTGINSRSAFCIGGEVPVLIYDAAKKDVKVLSGQVGSADAYLGSSVSLANCQFTAVSPVESRKGAVIGAYWQPTRFPSPLIKPDVPISSIRLSDRLHHRAHGSGPRCTSRRRNTPISRTQSRPRIW